MVKLHVVASAFDTKVHPKVIGYHMTATFSNTAFMRVIHFSCEIDKDRCFELLFA